MSMMRFNYRSQMLGHYVDVSIVYPTDNYSYYDIRKEYPRYKIISSTTKRILDTDQLMAEFEKDYFLVVLDYDLNHNEKVIERLLPVADKVEILVNETCNAGCPKRVEHYREISRYQLEYDTRIKYPCWDPSPDKRTFAGCMKRPAFMSNEDIEKYAKMGFKNFKIVGRGEGKEFLIDSYIYYLVKEDSRDFIRNHIMNTIRQLGGNVVRSSQRATNT